MRRVLSTGIQGNYIYIGVMFVSDPFIWTTDGIGIYINHIIQFIF